MSGRGLGLGLDPRFGCPLGALPVANMELWVGARMILVGKNHGPAGLVLFPAGAVKQVARSYIAGVTPKDGIAALLGQRIQGRCQERSTGKKQHDARMPR